MDIKGNSLKKKINDVSQGRHQVGEPLFEVSVGYHLRVSHRLMQRFLLEKIQPHGITLGMWYFLRALWNEDGLTQRELSVRVGTMEPTTLTAINAMERKGLVRRERNSQDRRRINIYLTDKGLALKDILLPLGQEVTRAATEGLSSRETETLLDLLRVLQQNIRQKIGDVDMTELSDDS